MLGEYNCPEEIKLGVGGSIPGQAIARSNE